VKAALCLFGQPRCLDYVLPRTLKGLFRGEVPDIYVHTWDEVYYRKDQTSFRADFSKSYDKQELEGQYRAICGEKLKKIVIDSWRTSELAHHPIFDIGMFYSIEQSVKFLQDSGKEYEKVVLTRSDVLIDDPHLSLDFSADVLHAGYYSSDYHGFLKDLFFFGNSKVISKFLGIYSFALSYIPPEGGDLNEHKVFAYCRERGIEFDSTIIPHAIVRPGKTGYEKVIWGRKGLKYVPANLV